MHKKTKPKAQNSLSSMQTVIVAQMMSIGGDGELDRQLIDLSSSETANRDAPSCEPAFILRHLDSATTEIWIRADAQAPRSLHELHARNGDMCVLGVSRSQTWTGLGPSWGTVPIK